MVIFFSKFSWVFSLTRLVRLKFCSFFLFIQFLNISADITCRCRNNWFIKTWAIFDAKNLKNWVPRKGHRMNWSETLRIKPTQILGFLILFSAVMIALGFNTIDAMIWQFYNTSQWKIWFPNQWHLSTYFSFEVWNSYFLFGILPLFSGSIILGYVLAYLSLQKYTDQSAS